MFAPQLAHQPLRHAADQDNDCSRKRSIPMSSKRVTAATESFVCSVASTK